MLILELNDITHQIYSIYQNGFIHALILCVFFDIFTGTLKSFKTKETSSSVSLFGIAKHALVVLLIFVLNVYLPLFGFQTYAHGFTLWMVVTYLISIAENWATLGLPLPAAVKNTLIKLKEHTENRIHIDADVMKVEEKEKLIIRGGRIMSKKGIIDPGHGGTDPGATGFGIREKDWCLRISLYQHKRLRELGADVDLTRDKDVTLDSVARTNKIRGKYDFCISNHWNAFNGKARGVETIYPIRVTDRFARNIANSLVNVSKLPLRRVFNRRNSAGTDWYFMHRLTGNVETIIIEYAFMDHRVDHDWYLNDQNFYKAAESVVEEICKYIGIQYRGPKSSDQPKVDLPVVSGTLFRVQVGAFGKLENAERLQERLEAADIDTYLIQDQGLFKVQVGAYRKKENAEAQAKRVEAKGFDTFITTASGTPAHGTKDEPTQPAAVVTPSTSVSRSVNAGDKVILNNSANRYATGQTIPASVKNRTYTVMQTRPGQVLLQEIMSWVHVADVRLSSAASAIESGDRVRLNSNASRYATGEKIPASRKGQRYTVLQTRSGQVLLREILSWVHTRDVTKL